MDPLNPYTPVIAEVGSLLLGVVIVYAGLKAYGRSKMFYFLGGSILWTSIIENLGVSVGSYTYYAYSGIFGAQYPGYLIWVGLVPLWVEVGWIIVAMSTFMIFHEVLARRSRPAMQACLAGLLAVNIDAMIDPVASANRLWVWLGHSLYVMGVPLYNWVGWFLLIFFYDVIFNQTIMRNGSVPVFGRLESLFLRGEVQSKRRTITKFTFRLVMATLLVAVLLTIISRLLAGLVHVGGV